MNNITLVGRLADNPEIFTKDDTTIVSFNFADNLGPEKVQFFKVYVATTQHKFVTEYLKKGSPVTIFGSIRADTYIDKNNITRTSYRIYAHQIISTQSKKDVE